MNERQENLLKESKNRSLLTRCTSWNDYIDSTKEKERIVPGRKVSGKQFTFQTEKMD
jgi:hypothetical protein